MNREFFKQLNSRRKIPGNCGRCGNPNPDSATHKTCKRCRQSTTKAFIRRKEAARRVSVTDAAIRDLYRIANEAMQVKELLAAQVAAYEKLAKRIDSHDLALARLETSLRRDYQRVAGRAYRSGQRQARIQDALDAYQLPTITPQELSTMNHAYEGKEL